MTQPGNNQNGSNKDSESNESNLAFFSSISPKSGPVIASVIAAILADGLGSNEIYALSSFIIIIGDSLALIATQMDLQEDLNDSDLFVR